MKYTVNYNLKKPEGTDTVNIDDFNNNADILDAEINSLNEQVGTLVIQDNLLSAQINSLDADLESKADLVSGKVPTSQLPDMNYLQPTGEGKDVTVAFTIATADADIATGEKLNILFGKILKRFTTLATTIAGKAPTSHASAANTYGLGTTANYGHVAIKNDLTASAYADGQALSAYQGKVLSDMVGNLRVPKYATLTSSGSWTVPAGVHEIDVLLIGGGGGGSYGLTNYGGMSGSGGQSIFIPKLKVTPGQVIPYVIGAGGEPSNSGQVYGGDTSFNSNLIAKGGVAHNSYYHASYEWFWGWNYFILGGKGAPQPLSSGNPKESPLAYNYFLNDGNNYAGARQGGQSSSAGQTGMSCIIPKETIGNAYIISSGGGGGYSSAYNGGNSGTGAGAGGTEASPVGKNATQPGCSGGGGFRGTVNAGGVGYRGEIYIRY